MAAPSIKCHCSRPIDPAVLADLKRESALLIDAAPVSAPHDEWSDVDADGQLFAWCACNHSLQWSLEGSVLIRGGGLADYHPGLKLSTHSLACINASPTTRPFLFSNSRGILFYDSPIYDPRGGRLPRFSCNIVLRFTGRSDTYTPAGGGFGSSFGIPDPPDPEAFEDHVISIYYTPQSSETVHRVLRVATRAATLTEVFIYFSGLSAWSTDLTGGDPLFSPAICPPEPEEWGGPFAETPLFAGAYDHTASAWLGAAIPGITPEPAMVPRLVWFSEAGGGIRGPFLYIAAPGVLRPPGLEAAEIAATYHWEDGWSGPSAALVTTDGVASPWEWMPIAV